MRLFRFSGFKNVCSTANDVDNTAGEKTSYILLMGIEIIVASIDITTEAPQNNSSKPKTRATI